MHPREELRRLILEHLGSNGVLVGFNIGWLLTAVRLPVPAFRVVDLGLEPTFQQFVLQLANDARDFNGFFDVPRRVSFDRRWPAVLFKSGQSIDFYPHEGDSALLEGYYTAAIWNAIGYHIAAERQRPEVALLKNAYVIGFGEAINEKEVKMLKLHRTHFRKHIGPGPNDEVFSKGLAAKDINQLFELSADTIQYEIRNERCRHRKSPSTMFRLEQDLRYYAKRNVLSEAGPRSPQAAFRGCD